jgi:hypothetical protein
MRATNVIAGALVAAGAVVGVTLSQAETKVVDGVPRWVVPCVEIDGDEERVVDARLAARCARLGVPAAVLGAGIGYFTTSGGLLAAALLGALALGALAARWREAWPQNLGLAGDNARQAESLVLGLVGALVVSAVMAKLAQHQEKYPRRLPAMEPGDA